MIYPYRWRRQATLGENNSDWLPCRRHPGQGEFLPEHATRGPAQVAGEQGVGAGGGVDGRVKHQTAQQEMVDFGVNPGIGN